MAEPTRTNIEALNGKVMPIPAFPATRVAAAGLSSRDFSIHGMVTEPDGRGDRRLVVDHPAEACRRHGGRPGGSLGTAISEFNRSMERSSTPVLSSRYPMKTNAMVASTIFISHRRVKGGPADLRRRDPRERQDDQESEDHGLSNAALEKGRPQQDDGQIGCQAQMPIMLLLLTG